MTHPSPSAYAIISALTIYPVKSCAGISLQRARITTTGFEHDRQWMIVRPDGRFITQREVPRLALIETGLVSDVLQLRAPGSSSITVALGHAGAEVQVVCWRNHCRAIDAGDNVAAWLESFLGSAHRLVRFDPTFKRASDKAWTGDIDAFAQFADAFPWMMLSEASLEDLNTRLAWPLPMNRFRPNIVVRGVQAFEEDTIAELFDARVALHPVKACTRCAITTTSQERGERDGDEPLRTLRSFRMDRQLKGVTFGQNVVLSKGTGEWLEVGQRLELRHRHDRSLGVTPIAVP
jgi:uncharacterized protein